MNAGCDVIGCHLDAPQVVIETAEGRGVKTCGHAFDQGPLAPKGYITGADYNWTALFEPFVETLRRGGTLPNFVTGGYDKGYVRSSPFGAGATPAAINAAKAAMQAMKNEDAIFVGPILDNTGKRVVPPGTTYGPYADVLQQTNYLIEGVIGSITCDEKFARTKPSSVRSASISGILREGVVSAGHHNARCPLLGSSTGEPALGCHRSLWSDSRR